jgi:hypothetical protein
VPIEYAVSDDGHFIEATASGLVTTQKYINYGITHVVNKHVRAPFSELLVI